MPGPASHAGHPELEEELRRKREEFSCRFEATRVDFTRPVVSSRYGGIVDTLGPIPQATRHVGQLSSDGHSTVTLIGALLFLPIRSISKSNIHGLHSGS